MRQLAGRIAVITGAGSGIGRSLGAALAQHGCGLALVDINAATLEETAALARAVGADVSTHVLDVGDRQRMSELPEQVIAHHGHVHIVVNNAGISVTKSIEEHSLDDLEWLVGINFWGVVYGCKFFIPYLKREPEGHIVNLSSIFGIIGLPSQGSYNAVKFAVRGLSECLHAELAPARIGVTSVHPGGIQTNIIRASRMLDEDDRANIQQSFNRFGMPPDRAAAKIVRAIQRNDLRLLIGREAYVIDWMKRLCPVSTQKLVAWLHTRREAKRLRGEP